VTGTIDNIQQIMPGAQYVRVQWNTSVPGIAELGEIRAN